MDGCKVLRRHHRRVSYAAQTIDIATNCMSIERLTNDVSMKQHKATYRTCLHVDVNTRSMKSMVSASPKTRHCSFIRT